MLDVCSEKNVGPFGWVGFVTVIWLWRHWHSHHHCHLCIVLLFIWLMSMSSYVANTFPTDVYWVFWERGIHLPFEGYICYWHIYGNCIVNKSSIFWLVGEVSLGQNVDYSSSAVGKYMQRGRNICWWRHKLKLLTPYPKLVMITLPDNHVLTDHTHNIAHYPTWMHLKPPNLNASDHSKSQLRHSAIHYCIYLCFVIN